MFLSIFSFYANHYKYLIHKNDKSIDITGLQNTVRYMITDIITDYENNIKMRFFDHLKNYINCLFDKKNYITFIKKIEKNKINQKKLISMKTKRINKTIKSILEEKTILKWINIDLYKIIPNKQFKKNSIYYDLQCDPQNYIKNMFYMNIFCEKNEFSYYNICPLKRSVIPGHIRIDTTILIDNFINDNIKLYKGNGAIEMYKDDIWNMFFKTDKKIFNGKIYKFTGSIQTDGFSISILQSYDDGTKRKKIEPIPEVYIDEYKGDFVDLSNKKYVSIDPNKDDLIYCGTGTRENNDFKTFRYTNNQRSKETRKRKNKKILLNEKKKEPSIIVSETELSNYTSKTNDFNKFKEYIISKNKINLEINKFYEKLLWRKLKLSVYTLTRKSESRMLKKFKEKFGTGEETFITFGDWSQKEQMKFKEPTKGKSFRSLFRKAGYKVFLVDEYRTSKKCCNCKNEEGICEKFLKVKSPRPWKKNEEIICNGLVKCKTCRTMFNRDVNSVVNMLEITKVALATFGDRPDYLKRDKSL